MKKGDIKKQEILQTAEMMFCRNGYETTSIQDILDHLHTSKGSFYHHYASKEMLLEEICKNRASVNIGNILKDISERSSAIDNLNRLFSGIMPMNGEKMNFLIMILPVFALPEGRQIRFSYAEALAKAIRDAVIHEIEKGNNTGDFFCTDPKHTADVCLLLLNDLWYQICMMILHNEQKKTETDAGDLLPMMDSYRHTLERLLSAPFGSLKLLDLTDIKAFADQIHYHWTQYSQSKKED